MKRGWTLAEIQADPVKEQQLVSLVLRRYQASADYIRPWHEKWTRYYKIYHSIADAVDDNEDVNTMVAYAYGIIEDLVSGITEPILQMRPPCRVQPKRASHERSAENFAAVASHYFHSSRYQVEITEANRELVIVGNTWENDCWSNEYLEGRRWAKVRRQGQATGLKSLLGRLLPGSADYSYESLEEVPHPYPYRVGYNTRFPWCFDIFPEPWVKHVQDMHWLIEQQRSVAIEDLERQLYRDYRTGQLQHLYNFDRLKSDRSSGAPGSIQPIQPIDNADYGKQVKEAIAGESDEGARNNSAPDVDRVYLALHWEPDCFMAVAQNSHVVAYQEDLYQLPRIPYRLKVYTPHKEFLYGTGVIEPVESQFYELNDIHKLSMRNFVRLVNKMLAYDEEAVTSKDDWKPRAGGRVRFKTEGRSIRDMVMPIEHTDATHSMLAQESNTKGLLERELAVVDFAPGVEGTKQSHKTARGLMEISRRMAQRLTTVRRMILSGYQDQMWFMEKLFSQFQFEKQAFTSYGPDGATAILDLDMWDIYTEGIGFDFVIEYDPSFGDDALLRNQLMVLFDQAIKYEGVRLKLGRQDSAQIDLEDLMRRILKAFGWSDTSKILAKPGDSISPDQELSMMMAGRPVAPRPGENLVKHLIDHTIQLNSPKLRAAVEGGRVDQRVYMLLKAHLEATSLAIAKVLQNPGAFAQVELAKQALANGAGGLDVGYSESQLATTGPSVPMAAQAGAPGAPSRPEVEA